MLQAKLQALEQQVATKRAHDAVSDVACSSNNEASATELVAHFHHNMTALRTFLGAHGLTDARAVCTSAATSPPAMQRLASLEPDAPTTTRFWECRATCRRCRRTWWTA